MFQKILIKSLKNTIRNLQKENDRLKLEKEQRDIVLKDYQEEHVILLENSAESRNKIVDLENNIELLTNNLDSKSKKLVNNLQSVN